MMENHLADPQRSPSFGTHHNFADTTQANIDEPAMAAGVSDRLWEIGDVVKLIDKPKRSGRRTRAEKEQLSS